MAGSCLDSWAYGAADEVLTRALQISLSSSSTTSADSSTEIFTKPQPEPIPPETRPESGRLGPTGKIAKRKPRASRRMPTTYITADPANFREMVQRMTGVRFGEPVYPVEPVRIRAGASRVQEQQPGVLPTLDTSALLLDRIGMAGPVTGSVGPAVEVVPGFDFESLLNFSTLDSWEVM